jgi:hypothetical protein
MHTPDLWFSKMESIHACEAGKEWFRGMTFNDAWENVSQVDYLLFTCIKAKVDPRVLMEASIAVAKMAQPLIPLDKFQPQMPIAIAEDALQRGGDAINAEAAHRMAVAAISSVEAVPNKETIQAEGLRIIKSHISQSMLEQALLKV